MMLAPGAFIRRFLLHVLPKGFHRSRHDGLLAGSARKANIARVGELLAAPEAPTAPMPRPRPTPPRRPTGHRVPPVAGA
jgi:hypothetical protein